MVVEGLRGKVGGVGLAADDEDDEFATWLMSF